MGSLVWSFPAPNNNSPVLYDDRTGRSYNQAYLAAQVNQDLSLVPRMKFISSNESPQQQQHQPVMEDRMGKKKGKHGPNRAPSHKMGPFLMYSQTYWNPFVYGGPNGPPTFIPSLGVWPLFNKGPEYSAHP